MNRYMIYMPVGTQGRLIPCGSDGSLTLGDRLVHIVAGRGQVAHRHAALGQREVVRAEVDASPRARVALEDLVQRLLQRCPLKQFHQQ